MNDIQDAAFTGSDNTPELAPLPEEEKYLPPQQGIQALWYRFLCKLTPNPPQVSPGKEEREERARRAEEERAERARRAEEEREERARRAEEAKQQERDAQRQKGTELLRQHSDEVPAITVAYLGVKGAAGTTATCAHAASVAGNVVRSTLVATDLNPAQGTLAARLGKDYDQTITIRGVISSLKEMVSFRAFIRQVRPTKYSVRPISANDIVGDNQHLDGDDAKNLLSLVNANTEYHYIDTANDITHPVSLAAVEQADVLVFTAFVQIQDSLRLLADGMETLRKHGFQDKVDNSVVVISGIPEDTEIGEYRKYLNRTTIRGEVLIELSQLFRGPFLGIPYDSVIRRDTEVDLEALNWETYQAYLELNLAIFEQASSHHSSSTVDEELRHLTR